MQGKLELMKITGYTDEAFQTVFKKPYSVMINPDSLKWTRNNEYDSTSAPNKSSPSQTYNSTPSDKLSFDIVIDCTGIVDAKRTNMFTEISALENIVYKYNGKIHRPNYVKIQWGKNINFKGVLTSFDTSYTLFRPDGSPLRAKISLAFSMYISPSTVVKDDNQKSPDITHQVTVVEGITLPQLCQDTWDNNLYYVQVARFNNLNKFRNLKGIDTLVFPPIIQPV